MLTLKKLKEIKPGAIIASGFITNEPKGIYMSNEKIGDEMLWIAKRGNIHDWAIYIDWASKSKETVIAYGDKLCNKDYIRKLVPCDNEAFKMYRY